MGREKQIPVMTSGWGTWSTGLLRRLRGSTMSHEWNVSQQCMIIILQPEDRGMRKQEPNRPEL